MTGLKRSLRVDPTQSMAKWLQRSIWTFWKMPCYPGFVDTSYDVTWVVLNCARPCTSVWRKNSPELPKWESLCLSRKTFGKVVLQSWLLVTIGFSVWWEKDPTIILARILTNSLKACIFLCWWSEEEMFTVSWKKIILEALSDHI